MLRIILLCYIYFNLQSLTHCGDTDMLEDYDYHRHIVEDGLKHAIFGSYSYDPVMEKFDRRPCPQRPITKKTYYLPEQQTTGKATQLINNIHVLKARNQQDNKHPSTYWWASRARSTPQTAPLTSKKNNNSTG